MRTFSGRKLCEHRTRLGWRPEQVAVRINRSSVTVREYEHGRIVPPGDVIGHLADAFGIPVDDLYETAGAES
jgi:transcriptional regulator with XRE-family HTH domain